MLSVPEPHRGMVRKSPNWRGHHHRKSRTSTAASGGIAPKSKQSLASRPFALARIPTQEPVSSIPDPIHTLKSNRGVAAWTL